MIMLNNKKDSEDNKFQTITRHGLTWLNIRNPDPQKIDALAEEYPNFHRLNLKDWLPNIQVPKIDTYADHIFIILYFPAVKNKMSEIRIQLAKKKISMKLINYVSFLAIEVT